MSKVCKFGGSSLASAEVFKKVKDIVTADKERHIVVVSAPGKRFKEDDKVTDLLYICHAHLKYNASCKDIFERIKERYRAIYTGCGLSQDIEAEFNAIEEKLTKKTSVDYIVSRGEYLNARLMAEYLGYTFVDSANWLFFNYDGKVDYERSYYALRTIVEHHPRVVIPGFYGTTPDGAIHTFSRGGSDVTGAIAAAAVEAECYENFTDVSGVMMADPRIVDSPKSIARITYDELRELSHMGAEVLHEETVFPVRQKNIPLYIKNTNDPAADGTLIMESFDEGVCAKDHFVTGVSGKKNYTIITISKTLMNAELGYIRRALEIFEQYKLPIEHLPTGVDCFSVVLPSAPLEHKLHNLVTEITARLSPDSVKVTPDTSLIAVVGRRMALNPGVSGKIFAALGENNINVRLIEQGADEINIMIGVADSDFNRAIQVLYDSFT